MHGHVIPAAKDVGSPLSPSKQNAEDSIVPPGGLPLTAAQDSPLGDQLFFAFAQIQHEFRTRMHNALAELDLDVRQYSTLAFIAEGHTPAQHDLAQILHLDPSQVVTLTKNLEVRGLLVRETVPRDRRAKALVITEEGERVYRQAAAQIALVEEALTASLSRRDRNALKSLLRRILPLP